MMYVLVPADHDKVYILTVDIINVEHHIVLAV